MVSTLANLDSFGNLGLLAIIAGGGTATCHKGASATS